MNEIKPVNTIAPVSEARPLKTGLSKERRTSKASVSERSERTERRAQESFVFMIAISMAVLLFLIFSGIISDDVNSSVNTQLLTKTRSINERVARTIHAVSLAGPGSSINVTLEQLADNYTIIILPSNTIINHSLGTNTHPHSAYNINETVINSGTYAVSNINGVINVKQI